LILNAVAAIRIDSVEAISGLDFFAAFGVRIREMIVDPAVSCALPDVWADCSTRPTCCPRAP